VRVTFVPNVRGTSRQLSVVERREEEISAASVRERPRRATKLLGLSAVAFSMPYFTSDA